MLNFDVFSVHNSARQSVANLSTRIAFLCATKAENVFLKMVEACGNEKRRDRPLVALSCSDHAAF